MGRRPKVHDRCRAALFDGGSPRPTPKQEQEKVEIPTRDAPRVTGGRGLVEPSQHGPQIKGWRGGVSNTKLVPWTMDHFRAWCEQLVFEDYEHHSPEGWQLEFVADLFAGKEEVWLVVPEGNSKTTLISEIGLYHLDNTRSPWVPVGASSRDQAEILFGQAQGFVERSLCPHGKLPAVCCDVPGLKWDRNLNPTGPFHLAGHRQIKHVFNQGRGMKVYAADHETADGVIPTLSLVDEGHRLKDLAQYRTWHGKGEKRGGQIVMISTAGEPGGDFEKTRESLRQEATDKVRREPSYLRAATNTTVIHEFAVPKAHMAKDLAIVKAANPLAKISIESLERKLNSPTLNYGESWLRLTCNIPSRSEKAAVSEIDWDRAYTDMRIPRGEPVLVGADFAWQLDTTALVPLWIKNAHFRLLDRVEILEPPRDGTMLDPYVVRDAFERINKRNPILAIVADSTKAQDTLLWAVEEFGCILVDRAQTNQLACEDYEAFMEALRGGKPVDEDYGPPREPWLRHNGDPKLREHVMNAIAAKRPGDKYRFDRASPSRAAALQDSRVIDALTAAGMVNLVASTGWDARPQPMVAVVAR